MNPQLSAPTPQAAFSEALGVLELPKLLLSLPSLGKQPRGNREPVMVLPGFRGNDTTMAPMRSYLRLLGYNTKGWGLGTNRGHVEALIPQVIAKVAAFERQMGEPVRLVGWSLGGVIAREVARERPHLVHQVVTLGSPIIGGPKYTVARQRFAKQGVDLDQIEAQIRERENTPIEVPISNVFSRLDGIVSWQACLDHFNPQVEHVEVAVRHLGLAFSAEIFALIAQRLHQPGTATPPPTI